MEDPVPRSASAPGCPPSHRNARAAVLRQDLVIADLTISNGNVVSRGRHPSRREGQRLLLISAAGRNRCSTWIRCGRFAMPAGGAGHRRDGGRHPRDADASDPGARRQRQPDVRNAGRISDERARRPRPRDERVPRRAGGVSGSVAPSGGAPEGGAGDAARGVRDHRHEAADRRRRSHGGRLPASRLRRLRGCARVSRHSPGAGAAAAGDARAAQPGPVEVRRSPAPRSPRSRSSSRWSGPPRSATGCSADATRNSPMPGRPGNGRAPSIWRSTPTSAACRPTSTTTTPRRTCRASTGGAPALETMSGPAAQQRWR